MWKWFPKREGYSRRSREQLIRLGFRYWPRLPVGPLPFDGNTRWLLRAAIVAAFVGALTLALNSPFGPSTSASNGSVAVWANSATFSETTLDVSGSDQIINGLTHSNKDLKIGGSDNVFTGGTEYVGQLVQVHPSTTFSPDPDPVQVSASGFPISFVLADYQPGGPAAIAAGGQYFFIDGKMERSLQNETLASGLYFVTGLVSISASNVQANVTIVSQGTLEVSGSDDTNFTAFIDGLLFMGNAGGEDALKVGGSASDFSGHIFAPNGRVELSGQNNTFTCAILGDRVTLNGSNLTISGGDCRPAAPTPTPIPPTPAVPPPLPPTGGEPPDGSWGLPWLAAIAGALALMGAGSGLWFAYLRRRIR